ncbi:MAG TPA: hypothetical protein PKD96_01660 [Candidatus Absconditabacterales bacterium]|nr:hypothetical protein [Candidatus Absconditabacterales bacterium]HMT26984.1 hypothetical protein [Candidatus Absconditabacterales bacterium]
MLSKINPENDNVVFSKWDHQNEIFATKEWFELIEKSQKIKKAKTMTLFIVEKSFSAVEMQELAGLQVRPEDVFLGHSSENPQWVSLPDIWRDSEIELREKKIPYKKTVLRADAKGNVRILEIYSNVFAEETVVLRKIQPDAVKVTGEIIYDYANGPKGFLTQMAKISTFALRAKTQESARMKTLLIEANPVLSEEEKEEILASKLGSNLLEGKEKMKSKLISIPRAYLEEELSLREQKKAYVKIFARVDAEGKISLVYQIEEWKKEAIILEEDYTNDQFWKLNNLVHRYNEYMTSGLIVKRSIFGSVFSIVKKISRN